MTFHLFFTEPHSSLTYTGLFPFADQNELQAAKQFLDQAAQTNLVSGKNSEQRFVYSHRTATSYKMYMCYICSINFENV